MKILLALLPKKYKEYVALGLTISNDLSDDGYMTKMNWFALGKEAGFIK